MKEPLTGRTGHSVYGREAFSVEFELVRSNRKSFAAEIKHNQLFIRVPMQASDAQIDDFIQKARPWIETHIEKAQARQETVESCRRLTFEEIHALADKALEVIPERVRHYAPLVGVTYGRVTIRNQRSRWGSCSSKGDLNFNCLLMLTPPEVIDSVVVHELCHRKEMNHSERFYAEVLRVFPDYRACQKWLRENGAMLMAMMRA